ncbi:MAG: glutaredoxin family protein [Bryobacterales bacterium]|nr:glutaredoxin family protein [Bryobacteraceae bacterium]MDW8353220.1 glutaredoxin family protein [Bryobacterales bacterium]
MERRPTVTLYTRQGCHLCRQAQEVLKRARRRAEFRLQVVDVDGDEELRRRYGERVPVIAVDGEDAFQYSVDEEAFLERLAAQS